MSGAQFDKEWFGQVPAPANRSDLRRVEIENVVYFLSANASDSRKLFICNIRPGGIGSRNRDVAFQRAIRMVLAVLGNSVGIPSSYGFDIVFIDELHYFNRYERLVFHLLVRDSAMANGKVPLFMAYDLKQATDDRALTSVGAAGRFFQFLQAGGSDLVELTEVFRSTPEIASLLEMIDGAFPALDLEGEWQAYVGESHQGSGEVPRLRCFETKTRMLDVIVAEAHRFARQEGGRT